MADDLSLPLGKAVGRRLPSIPRSVVIGCALVASAVLLVGWLFFANNPNAAEPFAIVAIDKAARSTEPIVAASQPVRDDADKSPAIPTGGQTVTIIDGKSGARQEVVVRKADPGAAALAASLADGAIRPADPRLVESSRYGAIPRIAADGARPIDVYASTAAAAVDRKLPRIAIVVGGLGISATTTAEAIARLPESVTLGFAPYGSELPRWAARARGTGHEVLLQLPMEPFDYPDNDPGPQTLLASLAPEQNLDRLHWMLSRTQGYIGVTNYMGARFTSNEAALGAMLRDIGKRGLVYLDDGSSPRSIATQAAEAAKAPFIKADLVIDASANWADIDAALARLEAIAAERGVAVGTASALPLSVERIARWAKAAKDRGVHVVPLSTILPRAKQG